MKKNIKKICEIVTNCRIFVTHEYKKKNRGYTRNILLVSVYTPCAKLSTTCHREEVL